MPKQRIINESARSLEVREELRAKSYREYWECLEHRLTNSTRVSYWTNGAGKAVLLAEHGYERQREGSRKRTWQWESWDLYAQLCSDDSIAATFEALSVYTKAA